MATLTTRLQATKPASTENVNVTVLNNNFDLFDQAAGSSVGVSASRPASAFQGRMWYSTNTSLLQVNTAASASTAASWATITSPPVTVADTGWVNITPVSGSGTFQYRAYDRTVFLRVALSGLTSIASGGTGTLLAAGGLPAAYRPGIDTWAIRTWSAPEWVSVRLWLTGPSRSSTPQVSPSPWPGSTPHGSRSEVRAPGWRR